MSTYKEQLDVVKSYKLRVGDTYRGNCPFCGGRNTFGISNVNGNLLWHCYKASCDVHGTRNGENTITGIKNLLGNKQSSTIRKPIPEVLVPIDNRKPVIDYLTEVHALEAYNKGLVDIKYDPLEDRVMFPILDDKVVVGYVGRSLSGRLPKWSKYGETSKLFTCNSGTIAVLVEDAPSACAVGVVPEYTGVALLGTTLLIPHKLQLRRYNKVIVCLDPDAALKSIRISNSIPNSVLRFIPNDLKYFNPEEIQNILNL